MPVLREKILKLRNFFIMMLSLILVSCSKAPAIDVEPARNINYPEDLFMEALRSGYLEFYDAENESGNKDRAKRYARKALAISRGMVPEMEGLFNSDIPLERLNALLGAKYFIEAAFVNGVKDVEPVSAAKAQLMFDCWTDQEQERSEKSKEEVTSCQKEFESYREKLSEAMRQIRQGEQEAEALRRENEKKQLEAYHRQQLSLALAAQKKELRKLPEYSLIYFSFNSAQLGVTGEGILDKVAKDIELFKPRKVIIAGNADLIGGYEYNMKLAMARGQAVADYLVNKHQVDRKLLDVKAYGLNNPRKEQEKNKPEVRNRYVQIIFEIDNRFYIKQN